MLYALSSDKRFLEANLANDGKGEPKMGQISDVLDQIAVSYTHLTLPTN